MIAAPQLFEIVHDRRRQFDVITVRRDFPGLAQSVHGEPLVYLDNAATTQKPRAVLDAVTSYYTDDCANVHRAAYALGERASERYESAREVARRFIGAAQRDEIVFVRGATEAINLVAHGIGRRSSPGDEIIISAMEHHSNIVPWQIAAQSSGAVLKIIPMTDSGELDLDVFDRLLSRRTKLVAVTHVSNALGTINPIETMIEMAHLRQVPVLVDGAQAVPHLDVDVQSLDCDFYAFSGHKLFGPTGIGVLYGRYDALDSLPPYQGGGDMILSVTFDETTYAPLPNRLEAGTPNIAGAIGLAAALEYVNEIGHGNIAAHEHDLLSYASRALEAVPGVRIFGEPLHRAAVLPFAVEGVHPHDIATIVDQSGVAIRAGHHCAQPVWQHYGVTAAARASFALYNTRDDVDALVQALHRVREVFRR